MDAAVKPATQPKGVPEKIEKPEKETVVKAVEAIENGPCVLRIYMEECAKCGTCAEVCPVYYGQSDRRMNPADRSDLIRRIYKARKTTSGRLLGRLAGAQDYTEGEISQWIDRFYECTGCRRCATYCPFGIDNSVITRKGRAIVHSLGLTPQRLIDVTNVSLETGNTDGCTEAGFKDAIEFLEEEIEEECGVKVEIPVDKVGAEYFYVPPSGDVLVNPEATMGIAKIFHVLGLSWTMSSKCFDGANYGLFTGDDEAMKADNKMYVEETKRLQAKVMLCGECGHAHRIFKFMMEKGSWWGELPFEVQNVMPFTAQLVREGRIKLDKSKNPEAVTYHDPCNFGRSCGIVEEPREILRAACQDYREMTPSGAENWCCGGGGGLSAMDEIRDFRMNVSGVKKVEQIKDTGAKFVAAPCANCKRQLTQLMEHNEMDVKVGGVHDMVYTSIVMD
jgi:Fe-S oxidoreductase